MALKKTEDTRPWNRKHQIELSREIALVEDMDLSLGVYGMDEEISYRKTQYIWFNLLFLDLFQQKQITFRH